MLLSDNNPLFAVNGSRTMKHLESIEAFVEVVQKGSFSAAAAKLGVSASHISRQVATLEKELGVNLLFRTTRTVRLRREAEPFYAECAAALDRIRTAEGTLNQEHGRLTGQLRVTCATSFGQKFLGPFINEFAIRHPDIEVDLFLTNRNVDLIEEGFDLGIRMGKLEDSSMLSRRLCDRSEFICGSPDYFRRHPVPTTLEDLSRHNCLRGTNDFWNVYEGGGRKRLPVSGSFRANSGYVLLDAAIRGLGLVQLPDYYLTGALDSGQLVSVMEEFHDPYSGVWMVYPNTRFRPRRLNALIDFLADRFGAFSPVGA